MPRNISVHTVGKSSRAKEIFQKQKAAVLAGSPLSLKERRSALEKLEAVLIANQDAIAEAIREDFGNRSIHETKILEIYPAIEGLRYTRKRLKGWMKPQKRRVALPFLGASNRVVPQPKGVVGIIAPWNYPLSLVVGPLTGALSAGNRCMVKVAANSRRLCQLLHDIFSPVFSEDLLAILPGATAEEFTPLPFDHLVFTGSPASGRTVMKTAGDNLTPVTLELGGKSPAIIADDFDIRTAAERILFAKFMNAGQTCVAPDYLFVPSSKLNAFVELAGPIVQKRFPRQETPDYTSIVDMRSYERLTGLIEDAQAKGAKVVRLLEGEVPDPVSRKIPPTILTGVADDMAAMQQEIFGPILPVLTYRTLDEVLAYINSKERPLALYLFTKNRLVQEKVLSRTLSGGVSINDCAMHVAQHDLPFGGIGNSGMGQYHGYEGFAEFSKLRPVFRQAAFPLGASFLYPPYGKAFDSIYKLLIKMRWF